NQADTRLPLFEGLQQASVLRRLGSAKHDFSVKLVDQLQQQGRSRERARINGVPFIREDSLQLRNQIVGKTQQDNARNPLTFREHTPSARQDFRWPGEARLAGTRSSLRVAMSRYSLIAYGVLPGSPIRNAYARYIFLVMLRMTWPEKGFEERLNVEKCQVRLSARFAKKRQGQFARVVITPHRRLAAGDSPAGRNKVPTPRAMVHRVQDQPLMRRLTRQIGLAEKGLGNSQSGLAISPGLPGGLARTRQIIPQTPEPLRRDCRRRAIDRLAVIVGIGGCVQTIAQLLKAGGARVPVRDPIRSGLFNVVVGSCCGRSPHHRLDLRASSQRSEFPVRHSLKKLQQLGESQNNPGQAA